jgi:RNA polymerase sigma-70 factor (ECF subfamily)
MRAVPSLAYSKLSAGVIPQASKIPVIKTNLAHQMDSVRTETSHPAKELIDTRQPPDEIHQRSLMRRIRSGDRCALDEIVAEHHARITRLVSRLTGWSADAEDLVQEVFVAAVRSVRRFRGDSQLSTWLTRIALNVCREHHRKRRVRAALWRGFALLAQAATQPDALDGAQKSDRADAVVRAVARLKNQYREVIVLHYLEGLTHEQVAVALGTSIGAVQVRLHRARQMLAEWLGPLMDSEKL